MVVVPGNLSRNCSPDDTDPGKKIADHGRFFAGLATVRESEFGTNSVVSIAQNDDIPLSVEQCLSHLPLDNLLRDRMGVIKPNERTRRRKISAG